MPSGRWHAFYLSDVQGLWLLLLVPLVFLATLPFLRPRAARAADPPAAGFVTAWAAFFAVETMVDPLATGPLARALGIDGSGAHTALIFVFVLLGDFRIFLLLFHLAARERELARSLGSAARWTLAVPLVTLVAWGVPRLVHGPLPSQVMWLVYETAFAALALWLFGRGMPARVGSERPALLRYLRAICLWVFAYYALWATADVLILSGVDLGWALRVLPNQLYYAFTVPFAYLAFFSARRQT